MLQQKIQGPSMRALENSCPPVFRPSPPPALGRATSSEVDKPGQYNYGEAKTVHAAVVERCRFSRRFGNHVSGSG